MSLRKRAESKLDGKTLYEVKLGAELDVIVGGLHLGYIAAVVLDNPAVKSFAVIDIMQSVIDGHKQGLVPLGEQLVFDDRCELILKDIANSERSLKQVKEPLKTIEPIS